MSTQSTLLRSIQTSRTLTRLEANKALTYPLYRMLMTGVYLGYPEESIRTFLLRSEAIEAIIEKEGEGVLEDLDALELRLPKSIRYDTHPVFKETGFIPAKQDLEKGVKKLIDQIKANRFHPTPFPQCPEDIELPIRDALVNNPVFLTQVRKALCHIITK